MSNTSPRDQSALFFQHAQPRQAPAAKPRERLWTLEKDGVHYEATLVGHGEFGWELQIAIAGEFLYGHRHELHALAQAEGNYWRDEIAAHGWTR